MLRAPVAIAAPIGAAFIDAPLAYVTWCCMCVVLSFALDQLLIVALKFEIHQDFKREAIRQRKEKVKKMAQERHAWSDKSKSIELERIRRNHAHHSHHSDSHGHYGHRYEV